jgi:ParB/RepB/Spo0J family partition protein
MAKPSSKDRSSAAAADIRSMLKGTVASGTGVPPGPPTAGRQESAGAGTPPGTPAGAARHPADTAMSRTIRKDLYSLDPRRIVTEGFYVRETDVTDAEFAAFLDAVRARGEIDQPISVRTRVVSPQDKRYILVWGMRRLRAALELGLAHVPVRDFGEIDETAAIRLQLQENLNRKEMTPVETALAFWELHQRGVSGADIARDNARTKGYVSALLNAGQAIAALAPEERRALAAPGRFRVRDAQALMAVKGTDARVEALRALLRQSAPTPDADGAETAAEEGQGSRGETQGTEPAGETKPDAAAPSLGRARRADEEGPFHVRPLRGGRGRVVRIRWHDQDLSERPQEFVERFATFLQQEVDHLHARLAALETALPPSATQAADFQAAKDRALKLAAWLRDEGGRTV